MQSSASTVKDRWFTRSGQGLIEIPWANLTPVVQGFMLFPMQVTNWLALQVAPRPKWPHSFRKMHADDLAAIGYLPDGHRAGAALQGAVAESDGDAASCHGGEPGGWLDRLAALVAIPMMFLSPLLFWVAGLSFFRIDLDAAFVWSCVLGVGATAIALLSLRYVTVPLRT